MITRLHAKCAEHMNETVTFRPTAKYSANSMDQLNLNQQ